MEARELLGRWLAAEPGRYYESVEGEAGTFSDGKHYCCELRNALTDWPGACCFADTPEGAILAALRLAGGAR